MKKILASIMIAVAGLGVGSGAAYATSRLLAPTAPRAAEPADEDLAFVSAGKVLAPLVSPDGRLVGYVSFQVELDVSSEKGEWVTTRLPLLLNAINMRTYKTPMTSGPDGMLPNLNVFRKVVMDSSREAFGPGIVQRVALTKADPA